MKGLDRESHSVAHQLSGCFESQALANKTRKPEVAYAEVMPPQFHVNNI